MASRLNVLKSSMHPRKVENVINLGADAILCHGTGSMFIPDNSPHVRQIFLALPPFAKRPTVSVTIHSDTDPGNVFGVFNITFDPKVRNFQWCKISAQTAHNASEAVYICEYIIIGKPALTKRTNQKAKAKRT